MTDFNAKTDAALVDDLGAINAAIAEMTAEATLLKSELKARIAEGSAAEGDLFRVSHSVQNRTSVDWKTVAAKLNPSRQLVQAHTKESEVHIIKVTGRLAVAA